MVYTSNCTRMRGGYYSWISRSLQNLPIRSINFKMKKSSSIHDEIVKLVEQMLKLNKDIKSARTPQDKEFIQRQIDATNNLIDNLVYNL